MRRLCFHAWVSASRAMSRQNQRSRQSSRLTRFIEWTADHGSARRLTVLLIKADRRSNLTAQDAERTKGKSVSRRRKCKGLEKCAGISPKQRGRILVGGADGRQVTQ